MDIYIASNNGEIGGGEVMLLHLARAARSLGHKITVIGPSQPAELIEAAQDEGFATISIPAANRKAYMVGLRMWRARNKEKLLWCNGLVPALATANLGPRIVHLHQMPQKLQKIAAKIAMRKSLKTLVPSEFMASAISGTQVFENWVAESQSTTTHQATPGKISIGFLGRVSEIKGTDLLAEAIFELNQNEGTSYELVIGGETRFIDTGSKNRVESALKRIEGYTHFLGWVTPEDLFEKVDCVIMPSQWDEPFGLVAVEAMSARLPLLVSCSGALPSIVGEDYPWIFERGSSRAIAQTIAEFTETFIQGPEKLDTILSQNYWRWYENYSPEAGKERLRLLLETLERS
ncbi:glycosyltransferase family 4 protein [Rothia nasimurium]|uniref:glycosyltransferase family 4 protein n=1 Tax=Rothia nasimurium TaxID=85336 RepID=UPI001F2036F7|nr:glycosyltransferase family 4 protein [Rothia nasimurium]